MATPLIEMYTTARCGPCERAKRLLRRKGVSFQEISIEGQVERSAEMIRRSGRRSVPQIFIAGLHIGGYSELSALDEAGELERLLLPVTPPNQTA
jgi:glutaredoxin 3